MRKDASKHSTLSPKYKGASEKATSTAKRSILKCTFPSSQTFRDFSNFFHALQ